MSGNPQHHVLYRSSLLNTLSRGDSKSCVLLRYMLCNVHTVHTTCHSCSFSTLSWPCRSSSSVWILPPYELCMIIGTFSCFQSPGVEVCLPASFSVCFLAFLFQQLLSSWLRAKRGNILVPLHRDVWALPGVLPVGVPAARFLLCPADEHETAVSHFLTLPQNLGLLFCAR